MCLGGPGTVARAAKPGSLTEYRGPNLVLVRFGGGVRRRETIDPDHTFSPFLRHELTRRGVLFSNMEISSEHGVETGHGQGTLNILTGRYDDYQDVEDKFLGARFEAKVPTLFEYLRKQFDIPAHQALIVNGEDRTDEEFYSFSNHHLFGVDYRCSVLSLYRFKCHLLRRQIESGRFHGDDLAQRRQQLKELESLDYRAGADPSQGPRIERFWERWRAHYGDCGFVNPRGDRLLTELAVRAIRQLRPRLMMINYNDPDYVHWGNLSHYTRGVAIIDEGLQRLIACCDGDEAYRDNTLFVIVPDCGRDNNRSMAVPCQHHFNSRSSREIFALLLGPNVTRGRIVDRAVEQIDLAPTIGRLMGFDANFARGDVLEAALA
ncbi:MAG: hypothetical protein CMJ18_16855 [Phycisphaeraceae bacterium]|nr:hypothetical protein [Phycisphaeraceae bacterium]